MPGTWPRPSLATSRSSHPSICPSIDPSSTPSFTSSRPLPPIRSTRSSPSSTCSPAISSKQQPEKLLIGVIDVNRHFGRWFGHDWTAQRAEDLPYHEALEAANDLGLAFSFRRAATDVVDRGLVAPHPH